MTVGRSTATCGFVCFHWPGLPLGQGGRFGGRSQRMIAALAGKIRVPTSGGWDGILPGKIHRARDISLPGQPQLSAYV